MLGGIILKIINYLLIDKSMNLFLTSIYILVHIIMKIQNFYI